MAFINYLKNTPPEQMEHLEEKAVTSITRKKLKIDLSDSDLSKFFNSSPGKVFKNYKELTKELNDYFDVEIDLLRMPEKEYLSKFLTRNKMELQAKPTAEPVGSASTTKVKDLSKGKAKKLKLPQSIKNDKFEGFIKTILLNMVGSSKGKLLLTGDPGTGKSRTVEQAMSLLRLQCITIEAPHTSEEAIISIPYLIRRGNKQESGVSEYKDTGSGFDVINAESALITRLKRVKPIKDSEYAQFLQTNKAVKPLAEKYKNAIKEVNKKYNTVLFLDEFYRTGSKRIQNLFRTVLNGKLGTTPIPSNVYIIYASNMDNSDGSLDDIPLNHQFEKINFDKPSKNDFMKYMADRFTETDVNTGEIDPDKANINTKIDTTVYNAFMDNLTDDELGSKDESTEAEIRVSPRRWEEIIKYVNANLPVDNITEARALLSFLRDNMTDYSTKETHQMYNKYKKVLTKLIKETSNIDTSKEVPFAPKEWRSTLDNQIKTKLKMGDDRKYVPIISGKPGIGKTSIVDTICKDYELNKIEIDCSTLNADDVIGLTTPNKDGDNLTTEFSNPPLYTLIMQDYDKDKEPVGNSKYTHILFLDEISRTETKVFNSIRSLMLDKKVGNLKIPDDIMIICAMNPSDKGTIELSDHLKDTVDVIDSESDYVGLKKYFAGRKSMKDVKSDIGFDLGSIAINTLDNLVELFRAETDDDDNILDVNARNYWWTDGLISFYISPREFDDIVSGFLDGENSIRMFEGYDKSERYTEIEIHDFANELTAVAKKKILNVIEFVVIDKAKLPRESFDTIEAGITNILESANLEIFNAMNEIKSDAVQSFGSVFTESSYDLDAILSTPNIGVLLENILDTADTDTVISDISEVIDYIKLKYAPEQSMYELVKMWKILSTIDWTKYNSDITSSSSDTFVLRGFQPIINVIAETPEGVDKLKNGDFDMMDEIIIIANRVEENRYNMFIGA